MAKSECKEMSKWRTAVSQTQRYNLSCQGLTPAQCHAREKEPGRELKDDDTSRMVPEIEAKKMKKKK